MCSLELYTPNFHLFGCLLKYLLAKNHHALLDSQLIRCAEAISISLGR